MPIHCPIAFPRIDDDEMREIDYRVMKHTFATHNQLGSLADETVYQQELLRRLHDVRIEAAIEVPIKLSFRDFSIPLAMDLVVQKSVIYELKTVPALLPIHEAQLLGYMYCTNTTHGKLVNFRTNSVESRFVNSTLSLSERQQFTFNDAQYDGEQSLRDSIQNLVSDWGTGLSAPLYRRAILACHASQTDHEQLLPMQSAGKCIGNQRFHLLGTRTALGVTNYSKLDPGNNTAFQKLVSASPLKQMHWLNITHRKVTLTTIKNEH